MTNQIIGVCGIACFKCNKFINNECKGCSPKITEDICPLPKCAKNKGMEFCFDCNEFPCKSHYNDGPFNKEVLDFHKGE